MGKKVRGCIPYDYDYEKAFKNQIETLNEYFIENLLRNKLKFVYACKEIRAGKQLEVDLYPEFSRIDVPEEGRIKRDNSKAQKNLNETNSRKYVERLINENFTTDDIWITLTYSQGNEPKSMEEALRNMQNYMRRINYRRKKLGLPNAKYVYVTEYSPDEIRWHHHVVMDGLMDMDTVESIWKKGKRNETRRLEYDEHGLSGMSNYITKAPKETKGSEKGKKNWCSSTNLKQFRVRKVHYKKKLKSNNYAPIAKFIDGMVRDRSTIKEIMTEWYPGYHFTEAQVYWNDFNGLFYIRARMREGEGN